MSPVRNPTYGGVGTYNGGVGTYNGGVGTYSSSTPNGLAGWAVALIVIFVLLFVACIAYAIFYNCSREDMYQDKEIENNVFINDNSRAIVPVGEPQNSQYDDGSFTINTYPSKSKRKPKKQARITNGSVASGKRSVANTRVGRDPTMFIPGQEDKPDPEANLTLMITNGESDSSSRRYYEEDPPVKPKRDPTMYINGEYMEDPPVKPKRDPTMYGDGEHQDFGDSGVEEMYASGSHMSNINEEEEEGEVYDEYGLPPRSSYYGTDELESVHTQDPSESGKSGRSSAAKKKKKYQEYSDNMSSGGLGDSMPNVMTDDPEGGTKRKTKSFY